MFKNNVTPSEENKGDDTMQRPHNHHTSFSPEDE